MASCLQRLPVEPQHHILEFLHWRDILLLRQVCRSLYQTSKGKDIWLSVFRHTAAAPLPETISLNKLLSLRSASELEDAILKPQKADVAFDIPRSTQKVISYQQGDHFIELLGGGRWALAWRERTGELICYDLDSTGATLENMWAAASS